MQSRLFTSNFRKSLALAAVLVVLVQGLLYLYDPISRSFFGGFDGIGQKYKDLERFAAQGPVDVIVVGHSQGLNGVDARRLERLTGLRTYNCAIAGTNLHTQALMVRDYIVPRYRPPILLWHMPPYVQCRFDVNRRMAESDAFALARVPYGCWLMRPASTAIPYQKRSIEGWIEALANPRLRQYDERGFMGEVAFYRNRQAGYVSPEEAAWRRKVAPWHFPLRRRRGSSQPASPPRGGRSPETEEETWRVFREALEAARRNNVRILAFTPPAYASVSREMAASGSFDEGAFKTDAERIQTLIDEYEIPSVNYRYYAPISDNDAAFVDTLHLNRVGAEMLTDRIAHDLFLRDEPIPDDLRGAISPAERGVTQAEK